MFSIERDSQARLDARALGCDQLVVVPFGPRLRAERPQTPASLECRPPRHERRSWLPGWDGRAAPCGWKHH